MTVLQIAALAAVAIGGGAVVATTDPLKQTLVLGVYGMALTMLFFVFQDPDVALSEIVISTVGLPVMILLALRKVREARARPRRGAAMSRRARLLLFAVAAAGFGVVLVYGLSGLPAFGDYHGVYGNVINGIGVTERHATDLVTALNFDFRGFDTLGEEFILFGSVLGVVLILREMRGDRERPAQHEGDEHTFEGASEALRALSLVLIPVLVALGVYIVVHGQITPGGGFQGGVILAAGAAGGVPRRALHADAGGRAPHAWSNSGRRPAPSDTAGRARRPGVRRRVLQELPPARHPRAFAVGRPDRRGERGRGPRGQRRVPRRLERVPRPGDRRRLRTAGRGAMSFLPFAIAAWLFLIGLYGIVSSRNLIRTILSLTVVQSATYLVLLGVGYRTGGTAPIFADIPQASKAVDPVVQVLVLTDIVIGATVTATAAGARRPGPQAVRQPRSAGPPGPPGLTTSQGAGATCTSPRCRSSCR